MFVTVRNSNTVTEINLVSTKSESWCLMQPASHGQTHRRV